MERYERAKELYNAIKDTDAAYRYLYDTPDLYLSDALPHEIIIRDGRKVKLADPITYDDAGNIIPLSLRDNPLSPDIRYSWMPWLLGGGIGTNFLLNNGTSGNKTN